MNRKVKPFKQTVFLSEQCAMSKVTTSVRRAVFRLWHMLTIVFPLVYCPVDNTLFKVSPEIRCSGASTAWSLEHGSVPSSFKCAYITPLLKKAHLDPADVKSYRPTSNLSVVSKLLERLVSSRLVKYLKDNDLLPDLSQRIEQCTRRKRLFSKYWLIYCWRWTRVTWRCWHYLICLPRSTASTTTRY